MITITRTMRADALHNVEPLGAMLFVGEANAHMFVVAPPEGVSFTGYDVTARFNCANGQNVAPGGWLDQDGSAAVVLTPACYTVEGAFKLFMFITKTENAGQENEKTTTVCVYAWSGTVMGTLGPNGSVGEAAAPIIEAYPDARISALEARVTALEGSAE